MRIAFLLPVLLAAATPELVSVKKIWDQGNHNAFTDLIRFRDRWYCSFREADDHVGGDGRLRVLTSDDGESWQSAALVIEDGIDLRDPKLSITADGRLMMVAGGSVYRGTKTLYGRQPRVAFSKDGRTWTPTRRVLGDGDWLWRVTWFKGKAYGVAYNYLGEPGSAKDSRGFAEEWILKFAESSDGQDWRVVTKMNVPGRPNETTTRFLPNGDSIALVRREAGDKQAWIGIAKPPYREWSWKPAGFQFGGPNFIVLPDGSLFAGGRDYREAPRNRTALGRMTLDSYTPELLLPSGGDNSYPGLVWHQGLLWVSYYSSHEGKTGIYLAKVKLK